jgi:EAL domain-containing protein (putative c-di-GMP-specific phosphodiesterase class I)
VPAFHILPPDAEVTEAIVDILVANDVLFERRGERITLVGPEPAARVVELLRHRLPDGVRPRVCVLLGQDTCFPAPRPLDEWWRVFETGWFEEALAQHRFTTWFQPIVDTRASLRTQGWTCETRLAHGRIYSPAEIEDAARVRNETHLFDLYARKLGIRAAADQARRGMYFLRFRPSALQNSESDLRAMVQALRVSGAKASDFVLMVGESELVHDFRQNWLMCEKYRERGFALAIETGPGMPCLALLDQMRPDYLRIDQRLIREVEKPPGAMAIRKAAAISEKLGITVIADGVNRQRTLENLWLLGVYSMQGYCFGLPDPATATPARDLANLAFSLDETRKYQEAPEEVSVN